jgi:phage-related protein
MLLLASLGLRMISLLKWIGSSHKDLAGFPIEVRREMGYALHIAQMGGMYVHAKPFKGCGSGVFEIVSDYDKNTYRSVYLVNISNTVYVLHAFQKKSKVGIKTPQEEIAIIKDRLKRLKASLAKMR